MEHVVVLYTIWDKIALPEKERKAINVLRRKENVEDRGHSCPFNFRLKENVEDRGHSCPFNFRFHVYDDKTFSLNICDISKSYSADLI